MKLKPETKVSKRETQDRVGIAHLAETFWAHLLSPRGCRGGRLLNDRFSTLRSRVAAFCRFLYTCSHQPPTSIRVPFRWAGLSERQL